jgi:hypothetical protein
MAIFQDTTLLNASNDRVSISLSADFPLHGMVYIRRYLVTGTSGQLVGTPEGDYLDSSFQTLGEMVYDVPTQPNQHWLFQFLGAVAAASHASTTGKVEFRVRSANQPLSNLGGSQTITVPAYESVRVVGGFRVRG